MCQNEHIEKAIKLLKNKAKAEITLQIIDVGMSDLSDYEKELLTSFYIRPERYNSEKISEKWFVERTTVYKDKEKALAKFAKAVNELFEIK